MASFNKVLLMGNLTRDPQLRYLPSNQAVAEFGIACNRKYKTATGEEREEVTFVDITAWGKQAELMNQYFTKGKPIFIEGRLKFDSWEDKQGGGKRSKLTVVMENFQFIGGRDGGQGGPGGGSPPQQSYDDGSYEQRPRPQAQQRPSAGPPVTQQAPPPPRDEQPAPPIGNEEHFKEDDIPF